MLLGLGLLTGFGMYTFVYARGYSYLMNDSEACANCHVMNTQYDGWVKSSHRNVAGCNDCHTAGGFFGKYGSKALNGWNHSWAMTAGSFEDPIRIHDWNREITEGACRRCHGEVFEAPHKDGGKCVHCHETVGHP